MEKILQDKVALITGSTSGIGLGIAQALALQGASIMFNGLVDESVAANLVQSFKDRYKVEAGFSAADMSNPSQIKQMVIDTKTAFGRIDILINNAGIQHVSPIENFSSEKWDAIIAINLSSAFHTIQNVMPTMQSQGWGRIINIASAHGHVASVGKSAYVAAKHGLLGLTKTVALETATSGITCNAICPGWVLTPLVQAQIEALAVKDGSSVEAAKIKLLSEKQPSKEFVTPEQIGESVVFLCSKAADQIRGATLNIDGGWTSQ